MHQDLLDLLRAFIDRNRARDLGDIEALGE